jgi:hypothetical protein
MRIGNQDDDIPDEIAALGFSFTNKLKLLGFNLQNYGDITASNYEQVNSKVDNLIRFWERFYLSLPGRITIYKTLLIPQINYIATILTPPEQTIRTLQTKMEKFVLGSLTMAKDRIYRPVGVGGLGLFNLKDFVAALQCSWFKRCSLSINDNWRYRLALYGNGNPLLVVNDRKTKEENGLVLNNIIESFSYFKSKFAQADNNFMVSPFYCNDAFGYGRGLINKLDEVFFDCYGNNTLRNSLLSLTWKDLVTNGVFLTREEIFTRFNITLLQDKYNTLKQVYDIALRKYYKVGADESNLSDFFKSFKKGSKKFRRIMCGTVSEQSVKSGTQVRTFLRSIDEECPSFARIKSLLSNWNVSFLNSSIREFVFKYYNNILGLNSRVAHFNLEVNSGCTFCNITNNRPVPKETIQHLFFYCPTIYGIICTFFDRYIANSVNDKCNYFLSNLSSNEQVNNVVTIVWDIFRYVVWQFKLQKRLPVYEIFNEEMQYHFAIINATSKFFRDSLIDCQFLQANRK